MMNEMRNLKVRRLCIEAVDHENWLFISKTPERFSTNTGTYKSTYYQQILGGLGEHVRAMSMDILSTA
jgi:hypothetical protein